MFNVQCITCKKSVTKKVHTACFSLNIERTENDNPGANLVTCHTMFLKIIDTIKLLLLFFCLALTGTKCVLTASMQKVHNHVRTVYS